MAEFRLIRETDHLCTTAEGLAVDDTLPLLVDQFSSPPILHLYKFVPSAIVGRYQDINAALKIGRCQELSIEINRRSTGGGTVIMGPTVLALGFGINVDHKGLSAGINGIFKAMSSALIKGLEYLGLKAEFRAKNDIEVNGKKIAGLSASTESGRALLFHTSLLVDFDMTLLTEIMNTPLIKFQDKGYSCFSQRLTTVSAEAGRLYLVEEVMEAVQKGFEWNFDIRFNPSCLSPQELEWVQRVMKERYLNPRWIYSDRHPRVRMGIGRMKTRGGLLEIYLSLAGAVIESIYVTGDFFTTTDDLRMIENTLKYVRCDEESIVKELEKVWKTDMIYGITPDILAKAIGTAKENQVRL